MPTDVTAATQPLPAAMRINLATFELTEQGQPSLLG